jgi:hypothetical protein
LTIKTIIDEDFINYKKPSMYIAMPSCDFKCCREAGISIETCQNSAIAKENNIIIDDYYLIQRYFNNDISKAIVFSGLEPFKSFDDIYSFISSFRLVSEDDIVIYTGYYPEELKYEISKLKEFKNIIIKFGRYIPNDTSHFDNVLGVSLISQNQYAIQIS